MFRTTILAALAAVLAPALAAAAEPCAIHAHLADADGVPLRAAPAVDAAVLFAIPGADPDGITPEFRVRAVADGFAEIDRIGYSDYAASGDRDLFAGRGFVQVSALGFAFGGLDHVLHAAPEADAPATFDMNGTVDGPDSVVVTALRACVGGWVDVDVTMPDGRSGRGWGRGVCANQVSTCG